MNLGAGSSSSTIERLINDTLDKKERKCNFIQFNVLDADSFCEDRSYLSKSMYDFGLDENTIEAISRIGRISTA